MMVRFQCEVPLERTYESQRSRQHRPLSSIWHLVPACLPGHFLVYLKLRSLLWDRAQSQESGGHHEPSRVGVGTICLRQVEKIVPL